MLVLKRTPGTKVDIGDGIVVTVLEIGRHSVRLGFDAPKDVPVHRREITNKIKRLTLAEEGGTDAERQ